MPVSGFLTSLLLAGVIHGPSAAGTDAVPVLPILLQEAEAAFGEGVRLRAKLEEARKQFRVAAERYERLRTPGVTNAALFRNLGHAWYLAGDLPRAVLSYRRGLRLAPHDAGLRAGLAFAREQVAYPPHAALGRPAVEHWPPWLPRPSARMVLYGAVLSYILGCVVCARWLMTRRRGFLTLAGGAFAVTLFLGLFVLLAARQDREDESHPLVIVAEDGVLLRKGNGLGYLPRSETPLNRGVEARLLHARGAWLQIELAGGEVGWVPRSYMLLDEAEP